jgi:uncharacterized protein (TIGR03067 family)
MSPRFLVLFAAVVLIAAGRPLNDEKKELDKFQGEWKMVSLEQQGKTAPDDVVKDYVLTVKGDQWVVSSGGKAAEPATIKIDPTKDPKTIDLTRKVGDKETVSRGIYKLEGDTLTLCRTGTGERPKEFKTSDSGGILVVWKKTSK